MPSTSRSQSSASAKQKNNQHGNKPVVVEVTVAVSSQPPAQERHREAPTVRYNPVVVNTQRGG